MKIFFSAILLFITVISFAQNASGRGVISGKITDQKTAEELTGALITIENTTSGAVSDVQGNYQIKNLTPNTYTLLCKSMGYQSKRITGVVLNTNGVTEVNISMEEPTSQQVKEVVITGTIDKEKSAALLAIQRNSASVSDGVSAESIKKTPDKTTSDVLKRVSGASIQDNKFVIIRGLNDRYNAAFINGAPLPSSESDRKAFSFDIFPANLLDNLIVIKTATPDLPADFAGGIINITTKSIPDKNFNSFSVSTGFNSITTFQNGYTYQGGKYDWIGLDDGKRALSKDLPSTFDMKKGTINDQAKAAAFMPNDWGLEAYNASPNLSLQYTNAHTFLIRKMDFGSIVALTYNNSNTFSSSIRRDFDNAGPDGKSQQQFELTDKNYSQQILAGVLGNFALRINENNTISFKNLINVNTDDKVTKRNGIREFESTPQLLERSSSRWFTENKMYSGQLTGNHLIGSKKLMLHWIGSMSNINRNIPNLRRMLYTMPSASADPGEPAPTFIASIPISGSTPTTGGNIFYSNNRENIYSFNTDMTLPLRQKKGNVSNTLKLGGGYQYRNRDFNVRQLGLTQYKIVGGGISFDQSLLLLPEDEIFALQNRGVLSNGKGGFKLEEQTKFNDSYKANSNLANGFMMFDTRIKEKFRFVYGVRVEDFKMTLKTAEDDGTPIDTSFKKVDILPSFSFIYSVTKFQNLRLCYSNTVSRPEYREIAPFGFYDFVTNFTTRGNPSLKRASIANFDLRYEVYPSKGQLFSVSLFYKAFRDAIEQVTVANTTPEINFSNVDKAKNYGMELEVRLLMSTIFNTAESNTVLNNFTLYSNLALIKSDISVVDVQGSLPEKRPLQGQSPFIINSGIQYSNDIKNFSAALSFNLIGRRIAIVGNSIEPNVWEDGRSIIDFQLAKTFLKKKNLEVKINFKDGLAQKQIFYQDINKNKTFDAKSDNIISEVNNGRVVSVGAAYKF
ncbi:MAG: carboxypeptidase-like regulatory domain-containing protein [Bacteroidetes bacterium]|nr:carboxypeptidase-like regulatory domain-containing protein [Bacteroidota bacterium]